jgi:hypothetical protein
MYKPILIKLLALLEIQTAEHNIYKLPYTYCFPRKGEKEKESFHLPSEDSFVSKEWLSIIVR